MPNNRVLCKFFTQGACLKGESCAFSHGQNVPSSNVCTFYQKGACTFGSRCKYEHIEVSQSLPLTGQIPDKPKNPENGVTSEYISVIGKSRRSFDPLDNPLCSFAAAGNCRGGQFCPNIHGDLCPTCGAHCLHPFKPQERQEHYKTCKKRQNHLQVLKHSQEVECSVCFERILSKPIPAERKFGILSECDHPFCISCIRNWRSSSSLVMDVNSVLRACPICRKVSYFVIPSVIWYSTKEEKAEIVDSYKKKLRSIDCKYFEFGNGTCPFGSSCFYKHIVKEGSMLWNATLMPEVWDSSYMNGGDETDLTFDGEDEDEDDLWTVVQTPLGVEEAGDFNLEEEDLNNAMASLMLLGLFEGGNNHDSSNNNNNNNNNNGV